MNPSAGPLRRRLLLGAVAVGALTPWLPSARAAAGAAGAEADSPSLAALRAMGRHLRSLRAFTLRAEVSTDEVLDNGQKLQFADSAVYRVRPPDRLQAETRGDRQHRQFFYDGKTLVQNAPALGMYSSVPAPPALDALFEAAADIYGIEFPLRDLFVWGGDEAGFDAIESAALIGPARVGSIECTHHAFRQPEVDWQLWIENGARPLPRKMVVTTLAEASQPQYVAVLDWDTTTPLPEKTFTFSPPRGAMRIDAVAIGPN